VVARLLPVIWQEQQKAVSLERLEISLVQQLFDLGKHFASVLQSAKPQLHPIPPAIRFCALLQCCPSRPYTHSEMAFGKKKQLVF